MRRIGVVTVARSDYGIYLPILRAIQAAPDLTLNLYVSGMHLSPEFGMTVKQIERDGFEIAEHIKILLSSDSPEGIAKSIGLGVIGFSQAYARSRPDLLMVLGDRFEMYSAAVAALPFKIPVAHIHGGEITQGAIDDSLRHSITKLSHLHFVSTQEYANRVIQLGEESWRVVVSGAPSLDNLIAEQLLTWGDLSAKFGLLINEPQFVIVTYHPVTLEYEQAEWQVSELLAALDSCGKSIVFTLPNADTSGRIIRERIRDFVKSHPLSQAIENFGTQGYFSLMNLAAAMIGNSSSGIIEAASFELPVVNIGTRQTGRTRGKNVIDVDNSRESILEGIQKALDPQFRASLVGVQNLYGNGTASEKIMKTLKNTKFDSDFVIKHFMDLESV